MSGKPADRTRLPHRHRNNRFGGKLFRFERSRKQSQHIFRALRHHRDFADVRAAVLHLFQTAYDFFLRRRAVKLMIAEQGGDAVFLSIRHGALDGGFAGKQLDIDNVGQAAFDQRVEQFKIIIVRTRERAAFTMPSERKQQRFVGQRVADGLRVAQYFADAARAFQKVGAELDDVEGQVLDSGQHGGQIGGISGDKRHGDFGAPASDNGIFDGKAGVHGSSGGWREK